MGNVTGICFEENPLSKERAAFQEWKNASDSLHVSQAILHFCVCVCLFSYLGSKTAMSSDGNFLPSGFFQASAG